ncbi:MAG: universal stress protein [Desulfuromonadaceae bacterium]|nr:universal stress protein [Desulfuromonadaceae bacterium]
MPLKNILVHLDNSDHSATRLGLAADLAQKHQARLTALYIITHPYYEPLNMDTDANVKKVRNQFDEIIACTALQAEFLAVDWKVVGVTVAEIINFHAHYSDVVIIGQSDHGSGDKEIPSDLPERVLLGAGRPVLIVPYAGSNKECGTRVLVSWKPGREATRAVNDAIPLLTLADVVTVLAVNPTAAERSEEDKLCAHLACHGITARAEQKISVDIAVGDVLLNRVSDDGSNLLIMGAFAQTRLGTPALGDVARHILKYMTVPVLMSH